MSKVYYQINGIDISETVESTSLFIYDRLSHNPDTASFTIIDPDSEPLEGGEVLIYVDDTSQVIFGGIIASTVRINIVPNIYSYDVNCIDYRRWFDRILVKETYAAGQAINTIITAIVTNYTEAALGFTTNNVDAALLTLNDFVFNYRYPSDCLREMAAAIGFDWYIDSDKDIHFFYREKNTAPLEITDSMLITYGITQFRISSDFSQIRNKIFIQGGYELSSATIIQLREADGSQTSWNLDFLPHNLVVKVGGVTQTLGEENVDADDGTYEYMYNAVEKVVYTGLNEPIPGVGVDMRFESSKEVPVIEQVENLTSIADIAAAEGGAGIYEYSIKDNSIPSGNLAQAFGSIQLNKYAFPRVTGKFVIEDYYGFKAGQSLVLNTGSYRHNGKYIIQQVSIQSLGNNILQYVIEFGDKLNAE